jgi:parallel beta-helix repeat protein
MVSFLGRGIVKASGTIYIRADGSIDPSTAPIQQNGNLYTITSNIASSANGIVIERSNIIIDGAGYTLQGSGGFGFGLDGISNVTVKNINIKGFYSGMWLSSASNNNLVGNNVTASSRDGIYLLGSSNNSISENNITANARSGIWLWNSCNNSVKENRITANSGNSVWLYNSSNNFVYGNIIAKNLNGIWLSYSSNSNSVSGNNITSNNYDAIGLDSSSNNVSGNSIANNRGGIWFSSAPNNRIVGNSFIANKVYGVSLDLESAGNILFHNNFINNTNHVQSENAINIWNDDYPSGGNYWSDYTGVDLHMGPDQNETGSDAIGDVEYRIDSENQDNYPLMGIYSDFNATKEYHVETVCNSAVTDFKFNGTAIRFDVTGENGTAGFCRIYIPIVLMNGNYQVFVNDAEISYALLPSGLSSTQNYLYFTYDHSTKTVVIIPEFPNVWVLPLFMMVATLLVAIVYKRKSSRARFSF